MCEFVSEIESKTQFTGYKVALKKGNHYYSMVTGIEYKPGLVTIPKYDVDSRLCLDYRNVLDTRTSLCIEQYKGYTAIFKRRQDAEKTRVELDSCKKGYKFVILKMTVQKTKDKNCWEGTYGRDQVFIGPKIRSIKEIK